MIRVLEGQGFHINDRILPDLGIYQATEEESEQAFKRPLARKRVILMDGHGQLLARCSVRFDVGVQSGAP
jgi:hypothetical protein